ncbi:MAG: ribbon-helix-helix domain-containing protein, partial [Acidobacteriota bacterium]|nr:ribbon-helix-helix domain-containing protein [Acidobacteriota bacterium]
MRTTIDLPEALLDNAKRCARKRGITLSVLLQDALRNQLTRMDSFPSDPAFRLPTVRGRSVSADVD